MPVMDRGKHYSSENNGEFVEVDEEFTGYRRNLLKNIVTYSKEGCLFDGDYLEEWVYKTLKRKGIKTFADLRGAEQTGQIQWIQSQNDGC